VAAVLLAAGVAAVLLAAAGPGGCVTLCERGGTRGVEVTGGMIDSSSVEVSRVCACVCVCVCVHVCVDVVG
jgi:hypothetical protein